jgi:hypothetical protein
MNRYLTWLLLLGIVFAVNVKQKVKKKFTVSGVVQNSAGKKIKKVKLTIINEEGKKIESGKSKGGGKFKFKKIRAGSYTLMGEHKKEGSGDIKFTLNTTDVELTLRISDGETSNTLSQTNSETGITEQQAILPQQRQKPAKPKLKFEDLFFEYDSNLKALKTEIDSLKRVVKGYQKGQTMPNVSRELLDLIKVPTFQHQVELQNGTVVTGDILEESDSTLILKTQIGTLVLKKEMVVRMDELKKPGPKVILLGDPFIDYYPDRQIFSGQVKNVGEIRADFVRIIGNLFDQTTSITGIDSIFVKGTRIVYESNVVADTALEPGQTAPYTLTIPITKGRKAEYHTMDIHWEETK